MNGLDALVFCGGVGEHAPVLRERAASGLAFLGIAVNSAANNGGTGDREIIPSDGAVRTFVLEARADVIARQVHGLLDEPGGLTQTV